jgi:uncharacterized protein YpbB
MTRKVKFAQGTKIWDGINLRSRIFLKFMKYFSYFPIEKTNVHMVEEFARKLSTQNITKEEILESLFSEISGLLKKLKNSTNPVPLLRRGGKSKLFVTKNNLQFLDNLENILIELIFV